MSSRSCERMCWSFQGASNFQRFRRRSEPRRSRHSCGLAPIRARGLAVLSYGDYVCEVHPSYDPRHRWIVPVRVSGPASFLLFAVWTVPHSDSKSYVQPFVEAFELYPQPTSSPARCLTLRPGPPQSARPRFSSRISPGSISKRSNPCASVSTRSSSPRRSPTTA
jgi:hypothetical protein